MKPTVIAPGLSVELVTDHGPRFRIVSTSDIGDHWIEHMLDEAQLDRLKWLIHDAQNAIANARLSRAAERKRFVRRPRR